MKLSSGNISIKELLAETGATGQSSDYKDHTDPKYIGPGTWNVIHRRAFKAHTHNDQIAFIEFMKDVCYGFPCFVCKGHCTEYIKNHPMEEYIDVPVEINGEKLQIGLFVWSWKFHNAVNARIKKPIMNWDTAYNLYSETEPLICSKNCLEADQQPSNTTSSNISLNSKIPVPTISQFKVNPITSQFRLIPINR